MVSTYRSDEDVLRGQLDELIEERRREVTAIDRAARSILPRRLGRAAAGAVGIAGGLLVLGSGFVYAFADQRMPLWPSDRSETNGLLVKLLLGAWAAMGIAYGMGRVVGHRLLDHLLGVLPQLSGRPREDVARVQQARPYFADIVASLAQIQTPSLGFPLAAMGLLLPLTLHLAAWVIWIGNDGLQRLNEFDFWICLSAVNVGLAQLVVAGYGLHFGARLSKRAVPEAGAARSGWGVVGVAALVACFPGFILAAMPPLLTAVTGATFIPLAYYLAGQKIAAERAALAPLGV